MKCYIHRDHDAVAICRACARAICPDCVAEVGLSCSCKNRCEKEVAALNAMIVRDRALHKYLTISSLFIGLAGLVFLLWGLILNYDLLPISMGGMFLLWGVGSFIYHRRKNDTG